MTAPAAAEPDDHVGRARRLVADLLVPRPAVYWTDLGCTLAVGYAAVLVHLFAPAFSPWQLGGWIVAGLALYRAALFMHEIVHFRRGEMPWFTAAWHAGVGIPFLMPAFLYEHHINHHNTRHYGTPDDGEYLPLGVGRLRTLVGYLAEIALLPLAATARFLVGTPLSLVHPRARSFVLERCSPLVINPWHRREIPPDAPRATWALVEAACFLVALVVVVGLPLVGELRVAGQVIPLGWPMQLRLYLLAVLPLALNHVRTLAAHRYRSVGERMTLAEQLDDSINVEGRTPLAALLFPVGLRYHALHHLFPSIPYHALAEAHARIVRELPDWHAYRRATYPSFGAAVADLWRGMRAACAVPPPGEDRWFARLRTDAAGRRSRPAGLAGDS